MSVSSKPVWKIRLGDRTFRLRVVGDASVRHDEPVDSEHTTDQTALIRLRAENVRLRDDVAGYQSRETAHATDLGTSRAERDASVHVSTTAATNLRRAEMACAMSVTIDTLLALLCSGQQNASTATEDIFRRYGTHSDLLVSIARKIGDAQQIVTSGRDGVVSIMGLAAQLRARIEMNQTSAGAVVYRAALMGGDAVAAAALQRTSAAGIDYLVSAFQHNLYGLVHRAEDLSLDHNTLYVCAAAITSRIQDTTVGYNDDLSQEMREVIHGRLLDWAETRIRRATTAKGVELTEWSGVRLQIVRSALRGSAPPTDSASDAERRSWEYANLLLLDKLSILDPQVRRHIAPHVTDADARRLLSGFTGAQADIAAAFVRNDRADVVIPGFTMRYRQERNELRSRGGHGAGAGDAFEGVVDEILPHPFSDGEAASDQDSDSDSE